MPPTSEAIHDFRSKIRGSNALNRVSRARSAEVRYIGKIQGMAYVIGNQGVCAKNGDWITPRDILTNAMLYTQDGEPQDCFVVVFRNTKYAPI